MALVALTLILLPELVVAVDQRLSYKDSSGSSLLKFGRHISVSDVWLVVGAPKGYTDDGTSGLVYIYRKGTGGRWVFHSLLSPPPGPLTTKMNPGFFGGRVALSGDLIAVGTSDDDTYWPGSQIFMFRYDATTDEWSQESVIDPPFGLEKKFGIELALEDDLLAASNNNIPSRTALYRFKAPSWENEANLPFPAVSVLLSGGRVVVGGWYDTAYIFEKRVAGWEQTDELALSKKLLHPDYGSHVAISGTQLLLGSRVKTISPAVPMELIGGVWQSKPPLAAPVDWSDWPAGPEPFYQVQIKSAMSGGFAVIYQTGKAALYVQSGGKWTEARGVLPVREPVANIVLHGGQVFTGSGGSSGSVWVQDLIKPPRFQVTSDYPQVTGASIPTFDAGEFVVGTEVAEFAIASTRPLGGTPVRVDVSLLGDTSEFTLSQTQFEIGINQEIKTRLSFKPLAVGTREVRITFTPDMPGALPQTFAFRVSVVTDKVPLQFTQQPVSGFAHPTGLINALECQLSGTRPWTLRWFKDGRALPSANGMRLALPLKSTGRYYLEATNAAGTVRSREAVIGYYEIKAVDVATLPGGTARLEVGVTGPGIKIQWGIEQDDEWVPLSDTNGVTGSRTPVLTVRNARQSAIYRAYLTMPSVQGVEPGDATCSLYVVQPPRGSLSDVADGQQLFLGENVFSMFNVQFDGPYSDDPIIRVSGLPPGVFVTPDGGYIDGAPTKTGTYRVTITVTLGGFTGTQVIGLTVTKPNLPAPGIYWGWFDEIEGRPQKYTVVADLQPSGSISAVVHLGAARYPLAGVLREETGWQSGRKLLPYQLEGKPQTFWLSAEAGYGQLQLMALAPGAEEITSVVISQLKLIKPHAETDVPAGLGKHSVGFLSRSEDGFGGPGGHGFGSMTVMGDHRVTYVGQMPDGSSLTGSSWLSATSTEDDGNARLYFYQADKASSTSLYGAAVLTSDVTEPDEIAAENLEWQKLPGKGRILADGFDRVQFTFLTSRPQVPASRLMKPGIAHTLKLTGPEIFLEPIPFQVSSNRQPQFGKGLLNPVQARFDLYVPTGFLTGQFSLHDSDPVNTTRIITRQVYFRGMLLPEHDLGVGSFLMPTLPDLNVMPPTTLQTSPIVPGAVKIDLQEASSR